MADAAYYWHWWTFSVGRDTKAQPYLTHLKFGPVTFYKVGGAIGVCAFRMWCAERGEVFPAWTR